MGYFDCWSWLLLWEDSLPGLPEEYYPQGKSTIPGCPVSGFATIVIDCLHVAKEPINLRDLVANLHHTFVLSLAPLSPVETTKPGGREELLLRFVCFYQLGASNHMSQDRIE
jgi:hypothetical protein